MRAMPVSIALGDTSCVAEPSPPKMLDVPTKQIPICTVAVL